MSGLTTGYEALTVQCLAWLLEEEAIEQLLNVASSIAIWIEPWRGEYSLASGTQLRVAFDSPDPGQVVRDGNQC